MGLHYEEVCQALGSMFSHSVGNNDINEDWKYILCRADHLQMRYPNNDASENFLVEQTEKNQRVAVLRFYKKTRFARSWQRKDPYWKKFTIQEQKSFESAEALIGQKYYIRAYQVLNGMYSRYREMLPSAPIKKPGCTMLSVLTVHKDTMPRYHSKNRTLSKRRF